MSPSSAICVSQEGPANALALNKDCTQVVIAGRNVFKVFSIGENEFSEVCNLRVGKNLNLNFSSIDVAWSTTDENTIATAATNGAVVVWNLSRSGRSKQEHVFLDHKRTVNKVSFHLTDPTLLISGSQDGMMKCFDLRMKEVARTFISNTESIRDVQFSPHVAHSFAGVSENGSVQVWDVRRHERCLQQFTAHSGPVFACDWHPDLPWLATASRDKTIKVWDMQAKPNLEHTIYTIASVGHVKWRPQKKFQVASCALVLDHAVHVWDVRRPHVPLATFAEHRDVTTAVAWRNDPNVFLATSRDCCLYRHQWSEAAHPVLWANPYGVCISARGSIAHAQPQNPLPALPPPKHVLNHHPTGAAGRKQPTAGSLSGTQQATLERQFPASAVSQLAQRAPRALADPFVECARLYRMRPDPPHVLAKYNAEVARIHNRPLVSHVWNVVAMVCEGRGSAPRAPVPAPPAPPPMRAPPPPHGASSQHSCSVEEEELEEEEEWTETQFHYSGVLGLPTHSIYIPPAKYANMSGDDDESTGWVSAASAHYVDVDAMDWTLPEEAFPLRPGPPALPAHGTPGPAHPTIGASAAFPGPLEPLDLKKPSARLQDAGHEIGEATNPNASSGGSGSGSSPGAAPSSAQNVRSFTNQSSSEDGEVGELTVRLTEMLRPAPSLAPLLASALGAALRYHADLGDVQTSCVAMIVMQDQRSDLFPYIEESLQEQWLLGYIELLQRHKLWNVATEVISCAWVGSVWALSQQSSGVAVACGRCGRRTRPHAPCDRCQPRHVPDTCAVCHQVVRGLYAWCQGCSHGGHLHHLEAWMRRYQLCPAGCGHQCQLG